MCSVDKDDAPVLQLDLPSLAQAVTRRSAWDSPPRPALLPHRMLLMKSHPF